jgi:hypothetical protein
LLKKYDIASFASQIGATPIVDDDGNESECWMVLSSMKQVKNKLMKYVWSIIERWFSYIIKVCIFNKVKVMI